MKLHLPKKLTAALLAAVVAANAQAVTTSTTTYDDGTVTLGDNVRFDLTGLTATGNVYTLFSGTGAAVDLCDLNASNIVAPSGMESYAWFFTPNGTVAFVDVPVPSGYSPVTITEASQLARYTDASGKAFIIGADVTDNAYRMTGQCQYWVDATPHTHDLTFADLETDFRGGALYVGELTMKDFKSLCFSRNTTAGDMNSYGGAIGEFGHVTLTGNEKVEFVGNSATAVAGEYSYCETMGGAVSCSSIDVTGNGSVIFKENYTSFFYCGDGCSVGGAITGDTVNVSGNDNVEFNGNHANYASDWESVIDTRGGAIDGFTMINLSNNGNLTFTGNYAVSDCGLSYGGAVSAQFILDINDNGNVTFSGNYAAGPDAWGGAISAQGILDINNNGNVTFSGNRVSGYGGAIYATTDLYGESIFNLMNNGIVTFRGNYEDGGYGSTAKYRLRSVYIESDSELNLAAGEGQNITFYDTLYVGTGTKVSLNAPYQDKEGEMQKPTGDIVFSGKYAAQDLAELKPDYTEQELTDSLTTEVYATTNLYGGTLRIEDGAIYKGNGINVAVDSAATLRLDGGTLDQAGYNITLASGTTLDLQGVNTITAKTLDMWSVSAITFTVGEGNLATPLLTLDGSFLQKGFLTLNLQSDGTAVVGNTYALLQMGGGLTPDSWNPDQIVVDGMLADISCLKWEDGILYGTMSVRPELTTATWSGAKGNVWNTTDKNWTRDGYSCAYTDGVDVVFSDTGSGSVTLARTLAPKSVLVENSAEHDYTFNGDGCLAGGMTLTKSGEGSLTISTANAYTGGTVLNEGTLVAGSDTAFGNGTIQINGGVLDLGGYVFGNALTITEGADAVIRNGVIGDCTVADAGEVSFRNSSIGEATFTGNVAVTFSATTDRSCGAIYLFENEAAIFTDNRAVTFNDNNANLEGGAIFLFSDSTANFTGNDAVTFSGNYAADSYAGGGAISAVEASPVNFTENGTVMFSGNYAAGPDAHGGAIDLNVGIVGFPTSTVSFTGNDAVMFSGNYAAGPDARGGAICSLDCDISFLGNDAVTFSGNYATGSDAGGAIYVQPCFSGGTISIAGNDSVTFRGNYEIAGSDDSAKYRLRSIYMNGGILELAAGAGQDITFYDTLYATYSSTLSLNAAYRDKDGVMQDATGDIVFSGKYAAQDLAELKPNYTEQELANSLTTEVYTTTNLCGGRLRIEDGAIYKGGSINVAENSNATLRLDGGTLVLSYKVAMNAGSTLDLAGENAITAYTLQMADGTAMQFMMGAGQESAILNLDATLQTGRLSVSVDGDYANEHALITLARGGQYSQAAWTAGNVSVRGTDFDHLEWREGSLYYRPEDTSVIKLDEDTESDAEIDGEMSSGEGVDIDGNGHKLTVKHPVDLVHLAMENGVVRLEGENNNVVRITLTDDGTLVLAAGAGLKVGNIVSMVANGKADLEISGDIEINDIKAYGKPGNKGTLRYVEMTTAGDYTIENMSVSGSLIDIGEGTTLYMVNVDISADTRITDDAAWLDMVATKAWLTKDNTVATGRYTTDADTTLYLCGDTAKSITLAAGTDIVELTSEMFDTVTMTGTDLWLDMTKIAGLMPNTDYITLQFKNLENALVDVENLKVYATIDGETYRQAYATTDFGTTTTLYFALPEPATGTLSLLALAALAARRRRK